MNLILDWSGTLADDEELTFELTQKTVRHFGGPPLDRGTYRSEFTIPVDRFYGKFCPGQSIREIDRHFFALYGESVARIKLFPSVLEVLQQRRGPSRCFILSTLRSDLIRACLEHHHLLSIFEQVVGDAFDKREHLPVLLKERGLIPFETLFVGDTPHDVEAGRLAGVQTAAVTWGYTDEARLMAARPDYLFRDGADLGQRLDEERRFDSAEIPIVTVGGLPIRDDGSFLLIRTEKWGGRWGTPGGKLAYGETMADGFVREVLEETGLRVENPEIIAVQDSIDHPQFYKRRHYVLVNLIGRVVDPSSPVRINYESQEAAWCTLEEALAMDLNEPTRVLLGHLVARRESSR